MHARSLTLPVLCLATIVAGHSVQAAEPLKADLEKSKITFVGSKPDGTKHEGGFKKFEVDAKADFEDPSQSSIRIEIQTKSLWSDDKKLTQHLMAPDFFDVRKYPKAVFESTKIEPKGESEAVITGKLKMLDKTEELQIPVQVSVSEESVKLSAKFKLDRTKWGMTYGKGKIHDDVALAVELLFKR